MGLMMIMMMIVIVGLPVIPHPAQFTAELLGSVGSTWHPRPPGAITRGRVNT